MRSRFAPLLAVSLLVVSSTALAQEESLVGNGLSLYSGRTLGAGNNVIAPEIGWPGIDVAFAHGVGPKFDVGGRFTFDYGNESAFIVSPALGLNAILRFGLLTQGIFSLAFELEPGIGVIFFLNSATFFVINVPLALQMSIHPIQPLSILFGIEFRPAVLIGSGVGFAMPILIANPGVEYAVSSHVAITGRLGLGPGITTSGVFFGFRALIGATIKI